MSSLDGMFRGESNRGRCPSVYVLLNLLFLDWPYKRQSLPLCETRAELPELYSAYVAPTIRKSMDSGASTLADPPLNNIGLVNLLS